MVIKYYTTSSNRSPIEVFILGQNKTIQKEIFDALLLLEDGKSLFMPLSRPLPGVHRGLHELRFKDKRGQVRIVYFFKKGDAIYLLHAFRKKTRTMSKKDKSLILKRLKEI